MRTSIVTVSIAAFLAGCTTTPAEQAARTQQEADRMRVVYGPACERLGFTRDTDPWRHCVMGLNQKEAIVRDRNNAFYSPPFGGLQFDSPQFDSPEYQLPYFHQPYWVY
jgi:hypothetical protein